MEDSSFLYSCRRPGKPILIRPHLENVQVIMIQIGNSMFYRLDFELDHIKILLSDKLPFISKWVNQIYHPIKCSFTTVATYTIYGKNHASLCMMNLPSHNKSIAL